MARLNKIIQALEEGKPAITTFAGPSVDNAIAVSSAKYDGVVFESEHNPYDIKELRHCLQYMLNRKQILDGGTLGHPSKVLRFTASNEGITFLGADSEFPDPAATRSP